MTNSNLPAVANLPTTYPYHLIPTCIPIIPTILPYLKLIQPQQQHFTTLTECVGNTISTCLNWFKYPQSTNPTSTNSNQRDTCGHYNKNTVNYDQLSAIATLAKLEYDLQLALTDVRSKRKALEKRLDGQTLRACRLK